MIKEDIDRSKFVCVTFLDSTKTFDKVEHEILLKIAKFFGLPGNTYNWF